jgi:acyl carrier protein
MDSLAAMELCIALETSWNLAVVPEELHNLGSLQKILDLVEI